MAINFGNWDPEIHNDVEQVKRIISGQKLEKDIQEFNAQEGWISIQGSEPEPYIATLTECSCVDFGRRGLPCKHMYCLAFKLGQMEGLPVLKKKKDRTFDVDAELDRYKDLYTQGEITADAYTKVGAAIAKLKK